jgi:hypothetical protein
MKRMMEGDNHFLSPGKHAVSQSGLTNRAFPDKTREFGGGPGTVSLLAPSVYHWS